ncbi:hypothetical protein GCM10023189_59430 [Nibrella saemangeumensis]|uniref:DUF998 domain-containing protein n=1 Tax=Nibrella saemangeumensis TaxID=1084526 RepID=A0ABP8NQ52_9BACT
MTPAAGTLSRENLESIRLLTLLSGVGTLTFTGAVLLLHLISPEFDPTIRFISEYGVGSFGYLLTAGFLALGAGSLLLVLALFRLENAGGLVWKAGIALLTIWGVSVMLDGIFPIDEGVEPVTSSGQIHLMAAMVAFLALMAASLLLSLRFQKMPLLRWMATTALVIVAIIFISFIVSMVLDTVLQGLTQRIFVLACVAWLVFVAMGVRSSLARATR